MVGSQNGRHFFSFESWTRIGLLELKEQERKSSSLWEEREVRGEDGGRDEGEHLLILALCALPTV
jgi:hypothetical protein